MTTKEYALQMRALIEHGWTQGSWATDECGDPVDELDPRARNFCLLGAYYAVGDRLSTLLSIGGPVLTAIQQRLPVRSIGTWNDKPGRSKAEVLAVLDDVIANLA